MKYSIINRTRFVAALAYTFLGFAGFAHAKTVAMQQSYNARIKRRQTGRPADSRQQFSISVRHDVAAASVCGTRIVPGATASS